MPESTERPDLPIISGIGTVREGAFLEDTLGFLRRLALKFMGLDLVISVARSLLRAASSTFCHWYSKDSSLCLIVAARTKLSEFISSGNSWAKPERSRSFAAMISSMSLRWNALSSFLAAAMC